MNTSGKRPFSLIHDKAMQMHSRNKLARYFGINIQIAEQADPRLLIGLKERADRFANRVGFDPEEYFLYVHSLRIIHSESPKYFAKNIPIENRIENLHATFKINQKQSRIQGKEQIKFIDAFMMDDAPSSWLDSISRTTVDWEYPGTFLIGNKLFVTNIITWVSKDLRRPDFKKIKLQIHARPTTSFERQIRKLGSLEKPTEFDIPLTYKKDIQFILAQLSSEEKSRLRAEYIKGEKLEIQHQKKQAKAREKIAMNEQERNQRPLISIGGSVTTLQIIANSSSFTANQLGQDGATLSNILESMLETVQLRLPPSDDRKALEEAIVTASSSNDKSQFLENYKRIISLIKPTYEILTDFIPRLTNFL